MVFSCAAASAADPVIIGTWIGKSEVPGAGLDDFTLVFAKAGLAGDITVTLGVIEKETKLSEIKFDAGKTVTFQFSLLDGAIIFCKLAVDRD